MSHGFYRPSLTVELDLDHTPFEPLHLLAPAKVPGPVARVHMHEVLHFWQTLSAGYVSNLALGELRDVRTYERNPDPAAIADLASLRRAFVTPHADLGFSAQSLSEALCRYWDIHILNPVKLLKDILDQRTEIDELVLDQFLEPFSRQLEGESLKRYSGQAFDMLMQLEDTYAQPYRIVLEKWGSAVAVVLFPLVGYFALQTRKPTDVFAESVQALAPGLKLDPGFVIHDAWREHLEQVRQVCNGVSIRLTGNTLTPGWDVMHRSPLSRDPLFGHYFILVRWAGALASKSLDFYFALPGDPECRTMLASFFRPAVTLFRDGRWTGETPALTKALEGVEASIVEASNLKDPETLADIAEQTNRQYRELRLAALEARYRARQPA